MTQAKLPMKPRRRRGNRVAMWAKVYRHHRSMGLTVQAALRKAREEVIER